MEIRVLVTRQRRLLSEAVEEAFEDISRNIARSGNKAFAIQGMHSGQSTRSRFDPPGEDQIIVWVDDRGTPVIRGIYDALFASTAHHATYREFVRLVGEQAAETAVRSDLKTLQDIRNKQNKHKFISLDIAGKIDTSFEVHLG